jgi:hypothetical protein
MRMSQGSSGQRRCARPGALRSWDRRPVSQGALPYPGFIPGSRGGLCALCVHRLDLVQVFRSSLHAIDVCGGVCHELGQPCTQIGLTKKS